MRVCMYMCVLDTGCTFADIMPLVPSYPKRRRSTKRYVCVYVSMTFFNPLSRTSKNGSNQEYSREEYTMAAHNNVCLSINTSHLKTGVHH